MAASARFEPDAVAAASFAVSRRGFDTDEVRAYLHGLAGELTRLRHECDELRAQLAARPRETVELDEGEVAQRLGEEAARVLTTAREAANQIRTRSEEAAAALVDEANQDAARTREHADVEAARLRHEAQLQAEAEIEAAKREGREMVAEARAVRERMLDDVRRRREVAKAQLEQLRLGHERVLGTFELAADALASVMGDLRALVPDVRRNSAVETGPVPTVLPVGERDVLDDEPVTVAAPVPPPAVSISVPMRAAVAAPVDEREVTVDEPGIAIDDAGDGTADEEPKPTVLVSAFSLGEAPPADVAVAAAPEAEPVPEPEVEVEAVEASVVEPVAVEVDVFAAEVEVEAEPVEGDESDVAVAEAEPVDDAAVAASVDDGPAAEDLAAGDLAAGDLAAEDLAAGEPVPEEVPAETEIEPIVTGAELDEVDGAEDEVEAGLARPEDAGPEDAGPEDAGPEDAGPEAIVSDAEPVEGDESDVEVDASDEPSEPAPHRPSADDLFARIRAAREAVTRDAVRATAVPLAAPVDEPAAAPEPEPVRASVLVAEATADAAGAAVVAARDEALAPVEVALGRRLKRVLADEQNEVLDRLRRKNPVLTLEALVGSPDEHAAAYERAVRDEVGPAVAAGARSLRPELSDTEVATDTAGVADSVAAAVRDEAVAPLRERLARLLDGSPDAATVTEGMRTVYREWKTQRLDAVARHVAVAAHGQAAFAVLVPGTPVCWTIDPGHPCPDGEDNALGGPTPAGEPFPTGHRSAPAYVGCRCALAPAAR